MGKFLPDGETGILVGSYAPGNGAEANGMSDHNSWLILLDFNGRIRYKKSLGEYGSFIHISPRPFLNPHKEWSVLILRNAYSRFQKEPDFVAVWNWTHREDFRRLYFREGIQHNSQLFYKNAETGHWEVVFTLKNGALVRVDQNLEILAYEKPDFKFNQESARFVVAENLIGDYRQEFVLDDNEHSFLLNPDFKLLAKEDFQINIYSLFHTRRTYSFLLVLDKDQNYYLIKFKRNIGYYIFRLGLALLILTMAFAGIRIRRVWKAYQNTLKMTRSNAFRAWVLESLDVGVLVFDRAGRLQTINRKAREILQLPDKLPENLKTLHESLKHSPFTRISRVAEKLERARTTYIQEEFEVTEGNEVRRFLITGELLLDDAGQVLGKAISLKDITESARSREIQAWSEIARRLVHELKTPLSTMLLAAEKLEKYLSGQSHPSSSTNLHTYLHYLYQELDRIKQISLSLMQITDMSHNERRPINLNLLIRECLDQLQNLMKDKVRLKLQLDNQLPTINGNFNQLSLAISNIIKNSVEASGENDVIHISTYLAHGLPDGKRGEKPFVVVEIADTGMGIPESLKPKIFEPYISGKEHGTGLGLSIVKKVVDDHQGWISYESKEGVGTTFWLYFPAQVTQVARDTDEQNTIPKTIN
ncbi:MAG: PAS domain-containing protein [Calditrichaeota bacterium]|nr:PAS domain-containing protein [Calditrichota bacterium]